MKERTKEGNKERKKDRKTDRQNNRKKERQKERQKDRTHLLPVFWCCSTYLSKFVSGHFGLFKTPFKTVPADKLAKLHFDILKTWILMRARVRRTVSLLPG